MGNPESLPFRELTFPGSFDQRREFPTRCYITLICPPDRTRGVRPLEREGIRRIPLSVQLRAPPLCIFLRSFLIDDKDQSKVVNSTAPLPSHRHIFGGFYGVFYVTSTSFNCFVVISQVFLSALESFRA